MSEELFNNLKRMDRLKVENSTLFRQDIDSIEWAVKEIDRLNAKLKAKRVEEDVLANKLKAIVEKWWHVE